MFATHGFAHAHRLHRAFVHATGEVVIQVSGFPEVPPQHFTAAALQVRPVVDAQFVHLLRRHSPDAPEGFHGKPGDERQRPIRVDNAKAVRLAVIGSHFCQELVVGNTCRSHQMQFFPDAPLYLLRDVHGHGDAFLVVGHVQEGFVQGQWLHKVGVFMEDFPYLERHFLVVRHPAGHEDELRAQLLCPQRRHGRPHAVAPRLVAGGGHHAARFLMPHGKGFAPVLRVVALFHGSVERVHVNMDDFPDLFHLSPLCGKGNQKGKEKPSARSGNLVHAGKNFIFSLRMCIFRLRMYILRLRICISNLKIKKLPA